MTLDQWAHYSEVFSQAQSLISMMQSATKNGDFEKANEMMARIKELDFEGMIVKRPSSSSYKKGYATRGPKPTVRRL